MSDKMTLLPEEMFVQFENAIEGKTEPLEIVKIKLRLFDQFKTDFAYMIEQIEKETTGSYFLNDAPFKPGDHVTVNLKGYPLDEYKIIEGEFIDDQEIYHTVNLEDTSDIRWFSVRLLTKVEKQNG